MIISILHIFALLLAITAMLLQSRAAKKEEYKDRYIGMIIAMGVLRFALLLDSIGDALSP
jgi:hypothetical protein